MMVHDYQKPKDGYYDEKGQWQRTKFCFVPCPPERCTCMPPDKKANGYHWENGVKVYHSWYDYYDI